MELLGGGGEGPGPGMVALGTSDSDLHIVDLQTNTRVQGAQSTSTSASAGASAGAHDGAAGLHAKGGILAISSDASGHIMTTAGMDGKVTEQTRDQSR